jgi:hypothetical protein
MLSWIVRHRSKIIERKNSTKEFLDISLFISSLFNLYFRKKMEKKINHKETPIKFKKAVYRRATDTTKALNSFLIGMDIRVSRASRNDIFVL